MADRVGLKLAGLLQDFRAVAGFTRDRYVALDFEQHAECAPQDGMIIGDQQANSRHAGQSDRWEYARGSSSHARAAHSERSESK